ncbi:MAG: hypothetical protein U0I89_03320 [Prevotella sp.]|nr:hypothetical protein [Prevotella sp.]
MKEDILSKLLSDNTVGENISALYAEVATQPQAASFREEIEKTETDYRMMCQFMCRGFRDPDAEKMYANMQHRLYDIAVGMTVDQLCRTKVSYMRAAEVSRLFELQPDSVRSNLERFVQDEALLALDGTNIASNQKKIDELRNRHYVYINQLFASVLVSHAWTESQQKGFALLLTSPTIDVKDAQLMVTAITLSVINVYCPRKWYTLVQVYLQATAAGNTALAQCALVGWVWAMPPVALIHRFTEVEAALQALFAHQSLFTELAELQKQMMYCCRADSDTTEIQNNIIPTLMENSNLEITRLGIREKDDDPMADIMGTNDAEQRMGKMEQTFKKMQDMQREGADVFFGGFAQMKRFSFFNELINWFLPYSSTHPLLNEIYNKEPDCQLFADLLNDAPFCDSDKYSFLLALSTVLKQLPQEVRHSIKENKMAFGGIMSDSDRSSATYLRRVYLQNLYRFFRLNNHRSDFINPFVSATQLHAQPLSHPLIATLEEKWLAQVDVAPISVLSFIAQYAFKQQNNEMAVDCYKRLCQISVDNFTYNLRLSVAMLSLGKIAEALPLLYKLDFQYPNNRNVSRAMAWAQLLNGEPEKAFTRYELLLKAPSAIPADSLNAAYAAWVTGRYQQAAERLAHFCTLHKKGAQGCKQLLAQQIQKDHVIFKRYPISAVEQNIMFDIVCDIYNTKKNPYS